MNSYLFQGWWWGCDYLYYQYVFPIIKWSNNKFPNILLLYFQLYNAEGSKIFQITISKYSYSSILDSRLSEWYFWSTVKSDSFSLTSADAQYLKVSLHWIYTNNSEVNFIEFNILFHVVNNCKDNSRFLREKENVVCCCKHQKEVSSTCNNQLDYTDTQLLRSKLAVTIYVCV